jgi:hypothetical protein
MEETSRIALDLIQSDDRILWVGNQLLATFAEGVTQSAKERGSLAQVDALVSAEGVTQREKIKREKYETSRQYDEAEKIDLVLYALREVYVVMPAVQLALMRALMDLGAGARTIIFSTPSEEQAEAPHTYEVEMDSERAEELKFRYEEFSMRMRP